MKKFYLFLAATFSTTLAFAQVRIDSVKHNIVCVGSADVQCETIASIKDMRYIQQKNQLAIISSKDLVSTHYFVYSSTNQLIAQGSFKKIKAGEFVLIDLGTEINKNYSIVFAVDSKSAPIATITK